MSKRLKNFEQLIRCMPKDSEPRSFMHGACIEANCGITRFISTDGHRMAIIEYDDLLRSDVEIEKQSYLLSRNAIIFIHEMSKRKGFSLSLDNNHIVVNTRHDFGIKFPLIKAEYPDYEFVLKPLKNKKRKKMSLNRDYIPTVKGIVTFNIFEDDELCKNPLQFDIENGSVFIMPIRTIGNENIGMKGM